MGERQRQASSPRQASRDLRLRTWLRCGGWGWVVECARVRSWVVRVIGTEAKRRAPEQLEVRAMRSKCSSLDEAGMRITLELLLMRAECACRIRLPGGALLC